MAIAEMQKLNLVAMSYDKGALLDAMHRAKAVEVTFPADATAMREDSETSERIRAQLSSVDAALELLLSEVEKRDKEEGRKSDEAKNGFEVSYSEFIACPERAAELDGVVERIGSLTDERNLLKTELQKAEKDVKTAEIYKTLKNPFSSYADTDKTRIRLGVVPTPQKSGLLDALASIELCGVEELAETAEGALILCVTHKSEANETDGVLSTFSFTGCPYSGARSGLEIYRACEEKILELTERMKKNEHTVYELKSYIRPLKIYSDYLSYTLEKTRILDGVDKTERTFSLQAYVPKMAVERVKEELLSVSEAIYFEFSEPTEEDEPPTLLKNNSLVGCFEPITNMYSAPNYREFDPNAVMGFFYALFMGFIIGDMGYGLLMAIVGGLIWWKNRRTPSGLSRLSGAFACGGVFALIWGALFNSFFGFPIFGRANTIMPDPQSGRCAFVGIEVPSVLVISLVVGVFQLCVGYICKAVQCFRRGDIADGIFDGIVWAIFSVGVGLAIVGFVDQLKVPILGKIGGITAGVSLLIAMLTAGRKEKFFGKFTKGFGAAYGVINYASDILSYARLYGLMLSGAVIASIISTYGGGFIVSGNVGLAILGVVLLLVGHGFNLVMNLLGAYIHDARLQYVEFYGRFFEGEGELFAPLGSNAKYIKIK